MNSWVAIGVALVSAMLVSGQAAAQQAVDCEEESWGQHFIEVENVPARPGTELEVRARRVDGPFGIKDVEPRCVRGWQVTPRAHARLSRDRTRLILDPEAPPGTVIRLRARVREVETLGEVTVLASAGISVQGRWVRNCGAAPDEAAIERINIAPDTYAIFDFSGRMWSGRYELDPVSGHIRFGPNVLPTPPGSRMEGEARLGDDGRLTLDGVFFADPWDRPAGEACPMVFTRRG